MALSQNVSVPASCVQPYVVRASAVSCFIISVHISSVLCITLVSVTVSECQLARELAERKTDTVRKQLTSSSVSVLY